MCGVIVQVVEISWEKEKERKISSYVHGLWPPDKKMKGNDYKSSRLLL